MPPPKCSLVQPQSVIKGIHVAYQLPGHTSMVERDPRTPPAPARPSATPCLTGSRACAHAKLRPRSAACPPQCHTIPSALPVRHGRRGGHLRPSHRPNGLPGPAHAYLGTVRARTRPNDGLLRPQKCMETDHLHLAPPHGSPNAQKGHFLLTAGGWNSGMAPPPEKDRVPKVFGRACPPRPLRSAALCFGAAWCRLARASMAPVAPLPPNWLFWGCPHLDSNMESYPLRHNHLPLRHACGRAPHLHRFYIHAPRSAHTPRRRHPRHYTHPWHGLHHHGPPTSPFRCSDDDLRPILRSARYDGFINSGRHPQHTHRGNGTAQHRRQQQCEHSQYILFQLKPPTTPFRYSNDDLGPILRSARCDGFISSDRHPRPAQQRDSAAPRCRQQHFQHSRHVPFQLKLSTAPFRHDINGGGSMVLATRHPDPIDSSRHHPLSHQGGIARPRRQQ